MSPVIRAADARTSSAPGFKAAGIATPTLGTTEHVICRTKVDPGRVGRLHSHDREEVIVVLNGSGVATLGYEQIDIAEGDVVVVPAGTLHAVTASAEPIECLTIEPCGIRFFDQDGMEYPAPDVMA